MTAALQEKEKKSSSVIASKPPLMLNEQSTGALLFDPGLAKEMEEAINAQHVINHIKIMDNPLFMMQPNQMGLP